MKIQTKEWHRRLICFQSVVPLLDKRRSHIWRRVGCFLSRVMMENLAYNKTIFWMSLFRNNLKQKKTENVPLPSAIEQKGTLIDWSSDPTACVFNNIQCCFAQRLTFGPSVPPFSMLCLFVKDLCVNVFRAITKKKFASRPSSWSV